MKALVQSAARFSWAISAFGLQQAARVTAPRRLEAGFYSVTEAATNELGDALWAAFQFGDAVQRSVQDFSVASLGNIEKQLVESAATFLAPARLLLAWQELRNKFQVFNLVRRAASLLEIPSSGDLAIGPLVDRAYGLGVFADIWGIEGLGHDFAARRWESEGEGLRGLLNGSAAAGLPVKSLTMLHAGMGLLVAERLIAPLTPFSPTADLKAFLRRFVTICLRNSRPGYEFAAFESLGLYARTWRPQLTSLLDACIADAEPCLRGYFWHGIGRALYFLPIHFVPATCSPWAAADSETPDGFARRNVRAGLAWATVLVNVRQPEILESLISLRERDLDRDDSFSAGAASAIVMSWDISPGDADVLRLIRYEPDARVRDAWERLVRGPCQDAIEVIHPAVRGQGSFASIFQYTPLTALVERPLA